MKPKSKIELKDLPRTLRGYRLLGNRITSPRQARQMLGRLAGLRTARKQRALGWPNLQKAIAMRRLPCQFKVGRTRKDCLTRNANWLGAKFCYATPQQSKETPMKSSALAMVQGAAVCGDSH
jgi:hypothetical protein